MVELKQAELYNEKQLIRYKWHVIIKILQLFKRANVNANVNIAVPA